MIVRADLESVSGPMLPLIHLMLTPCAGPSHADESHHSHVAVNKESGMSQYHPITPLSMDAINVAHGAIQVSVLALDAREPRVLVTVGYMMQQFATMEVQCADYAVTVAPAFVQSFRDSAAAGESLAAECFRVGGMKFDEVVSDICMIIARAHDVRNGARSVIAYAENDQRFSGTLREQLARLNVMLMPMRA